MRLRGVHGCMIKVSILPVQLPLLLRGELLMQPFRPIKALRASSLPEPLGIFSEPLVMPRLLLPERLVHLVLQVPVVKAAGPCSHQAEREAVL